MTSIRIEDAATHTSAPADNTTSSGDYQRVVVIGNDGIEKEIWRGDKWSESGYKEKCLLQNHKPQG